MGGMMPLLEILQSQLTDVFRVGLMVALVITAMRTQPVTGTLVPLLAGVVFVAAIIPMTMPGTEPMSRVIGVGVVANLIVLAVVLAALWLWRKARG